MAQSLVAIACYVLPICENSAEHLAPGASLAHVKKKVEIFPTQVVSLRRKGVERELGNTWAR